MCEWLKTVSLLKSETTNDVIKQKKLTITKKNCKSVNEIILLSKTLWSLKFFIEKKIINKEKNSPNINEYNPIKLAKTYFSSKAALTSGGM